MTGALAEGGALGLIWLLMWAAVPIWFVFKLVQDWRGTLLYLRRDPAGFVSMALMLGGMVGWFAWLVSDGLISSPWSAAFVIVGLFVYFLKGQLCAKS